MSEGLKETNASFAHLNPEIKAHVDKVYDINQENKKWYEGKKYRYGLFLFELITWHLNMYPFI